MCTISCLHLHGDHRRAWKILNTVIGFGETHNDSSAHSNNPTTLCKWSSAFVKRHVSKITGAQHVILLLVEPELFYFEF